MAVLIETSVGEFVVDLFTEDECAPLAKSFLKWCKQQYYHGCLIYNVQPGCLAQTGDPTGSGAGGADDLVTWRGRRRKHDAVGLLSMASRAQAGVDTFQYGAQFFITLRGDDLEYLDTQGHAPIGEVAEGDLMKLSNLYLDSDGRPWQDVRVKTHVLDDPFGDDPSAEPPTYEKPPQETVTPRVPYGTKEEAPDEERDADKQAKSQAQVLEMIGDLPHADVEVPKNELFVCKLNKVTQDADLEIIFSRFGKIESCDVVRDWKTGDSLNFAFIAFEDEQAAVMAYKKMNNVLIDDSRIKVDFSQSVAKIWSRYTLQYKGAAARDKRLKAARELQASAPTYYGPSSDDARPPSSSRPPFRRRVDDDRRRPSRPGGIDEFGRDRSLARRRDDDDRRDGHRRRLV